MSNRPAVRRSVYTGKLQPLEVEPDADLAKLFLYLERHLLTDGAGDGHR